MTWGLAQAGNRASKTGRYLQWWDSEPEQNVMTSELQNLHNSILFRSLSLILNMGQRMKCKGSLTERRILTEPGFPFSCEKCRVRGPSRRTAEQENSIRSYESDKLLVAFVLCFFTDRTRTVVKSRR